MEPTDCTPEGTDPADHREWYYVIQYALLMDMNNLPSVSPAYEAYCVGSP